MFVIPLLLSLWFFTWFMISIKNPLDKFESFVYAGLSIMFLIITIIIIGGN